MCRVAVGKRRVVLSGLLMKGKGRVVVCGVGCSSASYSLSHDLTEHHK